MSHVSSAAFAQAQLRAGSTSAQVYSSLLNPFTHLLEIITGGPKRPSRGVPSCCHYTFTPTSQSHILICLSACKMPTYRDVVYIEFSRLFLLYSVFCLVLYSTTFVNIILTYQIVLMKSITFNYYIAISRSQESLYCTSRMTKSLLKRIDLLVRNKCIIETPTKSPCLLTSQKLSIAAT